MRKVPTIIPDQGRQRMLRVAMVVLNGFVALAAIGGGAALALGLEGGRFPLSFLQGTHFDSYVVPGAILAVVVGGSAFAATASAVLRPSIAGQVSVSAGLVLVGWIIGEVLILRMPAARSWTEAFFLALGLLIAIIGFAAARRPAGHP